MSSGIHPTAIIDPGTKLGKNISIGPYAVIEGDTVIGDGTTIGAHALIASYTQIGKSCRIFNGASVGTIPQDLKFEGEESVLIIGDNTIVREFCTINRGTIARGETRIGSNCALLAYCHVAHDCVLGDTVVISNDLAMAGHVEVGSHVGIGGKVSIHQFVRIGDHSFIGANSYITRDIIPFALCDGARIAGINSVGLERSGFSSERRSNIKNAYRILFRRNLTIDDALQNLHTDFPEDNDINKIIDFVTMSGKNSRGILRMKENA